MEPTYEKLAELPKLIDNYSILEPFKKKHDKLSYMQFDYAVVHELTLFMIEPELSIEELESRTDVILNVLPAIKRIFAQPCIHLKEHNIIMPTEAVRLINNKTIQHIASHSELWTDVKKDDIKPSKLLTRTYEDNYGIYENLVFCKTVDDILSFARSNIRLLRELIYTNQTIEINLLERVNHLNYFLALGKLHTGYSRNFDSYYAVSTRCLNKLQFLSNSIVPRLKRPVYKNNKHRPEQIKIHKTNILSMHKEYHQVYKLAKYFSAHNVGAKRTPTANDVKTLQNNYFYFCQAICLFAAGHFNFVCKEDKTIDFSRLNVSFKFKDWTLKIEKKKQTIVISVKKDTVYTIAVIPNVCEDAEKLAESVKTNLKADEYVVCSPYEDLQNSTLIDITSIESFRRIQQIILRGMINSDTERTECPFCSNRLTLNAEKSTEGHPVYECFTCRTEIRTGFCPTEQKSFPYTKISGLNLGETQEDDTWLAKRKSEAQMYFRNITELKDGAIVCPFCGDTHI